MSVLRSMRGAVALLLPLAVLTIAPAEVHAQGRRLALVIGINEYAHLPDLVAAVPDAWSVRDVLTQHAGFQVTTIIDDASAARLRLQIERFIATVQPNDLVVVYYAGHGIQSKGRNYLVPTDLPRDESMLSRMAYPVEELMTALGKRSPALKLLVLDACRNNPLGGGTAGLAAMDLRGFGAGTRIEFAAEAGGVARDGAFAKHLVAELGRPGLELNEVFQNVRKRVREESNDAQSTLSLNQLTIAFYFIPGGAARSAEDVVARALDMLKNVQAMKPTEDSGQVPALQVMASHGKSLANLKLAGVGFPGAIARSVHAPGVQLDMSNMRGANFSKADLGDARLALANLADAKFVETRLTDVWGPFAVGNERTDFSRASLPRSNWHGASLRGASFEGASLGGASFAFADLTGADFSGADLAGTFFIGADLTGAKFDRAVIKNTDVTAATLQVSALTAGQRQGLCATPSSLADRAATSTEAGYTASPSKFVLFDLGQPGQTLFSDSVYVPINAYRAYRRCDARDADLARRLPVITNPRGLEELTDRIDVGLDPDLVAARGRRAEAIRIVSAAVKATKSRLASLPDSGRSDRPDTAALLQELQRSAARFESHGIPQFGEDTTLLHDLKEAPGANLDAARWKEIARRRLRFESWFRPAAQLWPFVDSWRAFFPRHASDLDIDDNAAAYFAEWTKRRARSIGNAIRLVFWDRGSWLSGSRHGVPSGVSGRVAGSTAFLLRDHTTFGVSPRGAYNVVAFEETEAALRQHACEGADRGANRGFVEVTAEVVKRTLVDGYRVWHVRFVVCELKDRPQVDESIDRRVEPLYHWSRVAVR